MKKNFNYKRYDYSFLKKEDNVSFVKRAFAKTIGYDLATVRPMNEPVGRLFYFDNTSSALNNAITYEPIRTGGWEFHFDNVPTATWSSSTSNLASISYATSPSYSIIGTTITNT